MASFSSSAFSVDAFSELAFDFGSVPPPAPAADQSGGFLHPYVKYRDEEYLREQREELKRKELELAEAERKKLEALAQVEADAVSAATQALLEQGINRLRMERDWLMRQIDDEEAILVLMMSRPFH